MGLINSKQIEQPVNFSGSFSGSFNGNATSASYAVTASYAMSVSEEGNSVTSINTITGSVTFSAGSNVILNQSGSNIEINANFTQEGKYLIAGGVSWSGTGLSYDVSTLEYFFNGNKTSEPTTVTLDASDPYNNRFDAIVVDKLGVVSVVKGNASSSPEVPTIQDNQLQVSIILVEAATTAPTILSESIYLDNPTSGWTFSTYDTGGTGTGTINFTGTNLPKQGINCIESNTGARRGARFVRNTSFDAFQYTIMSLWVRFTGTSVATNKSLNVRFENSAGSLVGNNINLFSFGLQRNILNTWQLVVIPITSFGSLPSTVKGLKIIMSGGTVGQTRQWDLDYILLTNSSVPYANVPTITFAKDDIAIGTAAGVNIKQGEGIAITSSINPTTGYAEYIFNNISSSYAQTASYAISSSYAQTSSYSLSSLYAQTASYSLSSSYAISSSYVPISRSFGIVIDGGGNVITPGVKSDLIVPYNINICGYTMVADVSGSIVMDLWKSTYDNYPPTSSDSITNNQKPTIINNIKTTNNSLIDWNHNINSGDIIRFYVSSSSNITKITLILNGYN